MSISRFLRVIGRRLGALLRPDALDAELARELAFHVEQLTAEHMAEGMSRADAEQAARRAVGNLPLLAQECRDTRGVTWFDDLRQDLIYAWRTLVAHRGSTAVVVLSLALGIGANTAVLGAMHRVLRGPLPIPEDERVVVLRTIHPSNPLFATHATLDEYFAWAAQNRTLGVIGVGLGNNTDADADGDAPAERLQGQSTSAETFTALDVRPLLGRTLTAEDARRGSRVLVISHRLWQRRYAGAADMVGRTIRLNGIPHVVVGVMPEGFHYPADVGDYWVPFDPTAAVRTGERYYVVTARLKPGVTPAQAQADLARINSGVRGDAPRAATWDVRVTPVRDVMYGWTMNPLLALAAAVALVLLVACTNVAGVLLARTLVREPEIAVRVALGARRSRVVRQLLTESLLLAALGGALGVLVAWAGIHALVAMQPPAGGVGLRGVGLDVPVLSMMAAISIACGLLFGLAPALMASGSRLGAVLRAAAHDSGRGRPRLREALVSLQIAITFVLLIGAGLAVQSFVRLITRDVGFDPARLLTFEINFPLHEYMQPRGTVGGLRYYAIEPSPAPTLERIADAVASLPGVEATGGTSSPLINALVPAMRMAVDGAGDREETAGYFIVTPGFITTLRASVVSGRDISDSDRVEAPWIAVVNEAAARRFWPGEDAVGKTLRLTTVPEERPRTVVGVVRDIPRRLEAVDTQPSVYVSYLQQPRHYPVPGANQLGRMTFMVRATDDPAALLPAVRRVVEEIAPGRPLARAATLQQQMPSFIAQRDELASVLGAFALTGVLLAGIGVHGVMTYSVARRTREIGIRIALGAEAGAVVARVGRHALIMLGLGLATGVAASLAAVPMLRRLVWGISPTDPATFGAAAAVLLFVCAAASLVPARRAATVDPTIALRSE